METFKFIRGFVREIEYNLTGLFPAIQRIVERTIGMDLVSVQPMDGPVGQVFYFDYQYGDEPYIKRFTLKDFKFLRGC